jgi:ABC-type cobalamin/Fe3+-siderophores transport system ATPase subunit
VPPGSIVGLCGPNGAGKTTLLALMVSLLAPTDGQVAVCGEPSRANTAATLARVSYLAQDHPLYRGFTVAEMFHFGRSLNPRWDAGLADNRGGGSRHRILATAAENHLTPENGANGQGADRGDLRVGQDDAGRGGVGPAGVASVRA